MKRKIILLVTMASVIVLFIGCGQTAGDTQEEISSVTESSTVEENVCENNSHVWVEATCEAPKTCSVCGETEGDALEHILTEATYIDAPTCEVCGAVVGEKLQPIASAEEISVLQEKIDALVETYNTGNQEAIDTLAEYWAQPSNEIMEGKNGYVQTMNSLFDMDKDWTWWIVSIPRAFYYNVNENMLGECTFESYIYTDPNSINEYLNEVQFDSNNATAKGIRFLYTMPNIKEIATGNPVVVDIIYYEELQPISHMSIQTIGYGIINVNDKFFYAELTGDNKIVNILSEDEIFLPTRESIETGNYDGEIENVTTTGNVEYWFEEDGTLYFTAENIGDTITVTYNGYIGYFIWTQEEGDADTNSLPKTGDEVYQKYFLEW